MVTSLDRVLVVRLSALGDVTLASAVVGALRDRAQVALLTSAAYAGLYRDDARLSIVIEADTDSADARRRIASFGPTSTLDLQATAKSARILRGLATGRRVRVRKDGLRRRLTPLGFKSWTPRPVYRRYLDALETITAREETATPRLHVRGADRREAAAELSSAVRWVGIGPGSQWRNKRWPLDRWVELTRRLQNESTGIAVFCAGSEIDIAAAFRTAFPEDERVRVVQVSIEALPARLAAVDVLVTGDSGPLHVAEAVDTPVVAMFGPTTRHFGFRPFRPGSRVIEKPRWCRPCHVHGGNRCPLGHHRCMLDISVEDVLAETHAVLEAATTSHSRDGGA